MSSDNTADPAATVDAARNAQNYSPAGEKLPFRLDDPAAWDGRLADVLADDPTCGCQRTGGIKRGVSRDSAVGMYHKQLGLDQFVQFIPMADRPYNQLRLLYQMRRFIEELPPTRRVFTNSDLFAKRDAVTQVTKSRGSSVPGCYVHVHGGWPVVDNQKTSNERSRFMNPNYVHDQTFDTVTDDDKRRVFLRRAADHAVIPQTDLIPLFGFDTADDPARRLYDTTNRLGVEYRLRQLRAKRLLARVWAMCNEWGYSRADLAAAFGVGETTVTDWIHRVTDAGFVPPAEDPTMPERFRGEDVHAKVDIRSPPRGYSPWGND